jgi:hypothetical protein
MNVEGYFRCVGSAIRAEEKRKLSQIERAEGTLAVWDTLSVLPGFNARFKERGDGIAANLRGTVKGFPDSMMCASLTSDLEWCLQRGNASL